MRGEPEYNEGMFSYLTPAQRVPQDHPLREIRKLVDAALKELSPVFQRLYSRIGRPSIPPERLIRASVLQMLYSIRSERQLMEQLNFNILYRWFVGLGMDDKVWDPTVYTKNRARLLRGRVDVRFFEALLEQAREKGLLSEEHFTVDGTLIEAWASQKSFQPKISSTRLRFLWLTSYPAWRVVLRSIMLERFVVFWATWGVTWMSRRASTKSAVS